MTLSSFMPQNKPDSLNEAQKGFPAIDFSFIIHYNNRMKTQEVDKLDIQVGIDPKYTLYVNGRFLDEGVYKNEL